MMSYPVWYPDQVRYPSFPDAMAAIGQLLVEYGAQRSGGLHDTEAEAFKAAWLQVFSPHPATAKLAGLGAEQFVAECRRFCRIAQRIIIDIAQKHLREHLQSVDAIDELTAINSPVRLLDTLRSWTSGDHPPAPDSSILSLYPCASRVVNRTTTTVFEIKRKLAMMSVLMMVDAIDHKDVVERDMREFTRYCNEHLYVPDHVLSVELHGIFQGWELVHCYTIDRFTPSVQLTSGQRIISTNYEARVVKMDGISLVVHTTGRPKGDESQLIKIFRENGEAPLDGRGMKHVVIAAYAEDGRKVIVDENLLRRYAAFLRGFFDRPDHFTIQEDKPRRNHSSEAIFQTTQKFFVRIAHRRRDRHRITNSPVEVQVVAGFVDIHNFDPGNPSSHPEYRRRQLRGLMNMLFEPHLNGNGQH